MAEKTPSSPPSLDKEARRKKQTKRMSKILTKAWDLPHSHHFTESAHPSSADNAYDLAAVGQNLDNKKYKLGRHGWEQFAKDLGGVYNHHRDSKNAKRAREHLEQVVQWLSKLDASLGTMASESAGPSTKKRKSADDPKAAAKKKKTAVAAAKNGDNLTIAEREENALEGLATYIEERGGSRDQLVGFTSKVMPRSDGRFDVTYANAEGKRLRSMVDVARHLNLAQDVKKTTAPKKGGNKKKAPSRRDYENEKKRLRRDLDRMLKNHRKATKALDDFETERKESRYPIDDDLLMEQQQQQDDAVSSSLVTPATCPAARVPDIAGYPGLPSHCLPDVLMTWDFLCTFQRALSLNPLSLDDFVQALTYQPPESMGGNFVSNPSSLSPPVYLAEAHLGLLKLLLMDSSSDDWWWSILETDAMQPGLEEIEVADDDAIMDSNVPVIKIDMAALLAEAEDALITTTWLQILDGVRSRKASESGTVRKLVKDAIAVVTNKWVKAYLKKSLTGSRTSVDFTKRAILWLLDRMREARPDFWGESVKADQILAKKAKVVEETMAMMDKMNDSGEVVVVDEEDVEGDSDDEVDSDDSDDEDAGARNDRSYLGTNQDASNDTVEESKLPVTSTLPIKPPPTIIDLLLPPAKPLAGSDLVSSFTWPQLAGATICRILHRYKRLRNEVDDSLRLQQGLPPMTIGERRAREELVSKRMLLESAWGGADEDPSEKAARHLSTGGQYLELSTTERLCVLRLLVEAAYDTARLHGVVDDNFKSRIGAVKALDMEKRRAKREAKEEAAAAETAAREKLASEARIKFLEEKREEIEKSNKESHEYADDFIDGLTDDDIIEFDEETKAEYEALPGPESFNKTEVNKMVVRVQEENAFNTHALSVLTMEEIVFLEQRELAEMEERLESFGEVDHFSLDRETSRVIEKLRRDIENARYNAETLPQKREETVETLKDAIQDGTVKALRAAMRQAKQAKLTGTDEDTEGLWALDVLRDATMELKAAEIRKRIIDAQKDLVQKRNKCFIRTEPIGSDRFHNHFWHFDNDEDGRVWAEADYIVKSGNDRQNFEAKQGYVDLMANPESIAVGAEEKEEDLVNPDLTSEEKNKFVRFSRQDFHKMGTVSALAKRHWGGHTTEKSLRALIKNLDERGVREQELKANLKEALEDEKKDADQEAMNGHADGVATEAENGNELEFKTTGDEEMFSSAKQSVDVEEFPVVSQELLLSVSSAMGQPARVRELTEQTRDRSVAHYKLGTVDAWKMTKVEVDEESEEDEEPEAQVPKVALVPMWRVTYERGGEIWLTGGELLDSLCRYVRWKNKDAIYVEQDAAFLAYRNSTGRHCGKASDAALSSTPIYLARLMVKREQELYFSLKNRSYDNTWGGKIGNRNVWTTEMKDFCHDLQTARNGLLTLEHAFFELTGGTPDDGPPPDAKKILSEETSLFEVELESMEKVAEGLWNSRESRAIFRYIVENSQTTGTLALALDLLCRNCRAYLDRNKVAEPRRSVVAQAPTARNTRRMNAWQKSNENWY